MRKVNQLRLHWIGMSLLIFSVGCGGPDSFQGPNSNPEPSPTTPILLENMIQAQEAEAAAKDYLEAWKAEDYLGMYNMLTSISQDALTPDEFSSFYRSVAAETALSSLETHILSSLVQSRTAQVSYWVLLHSVLVKDIQRQTMMNLSLENGLWRVQWDEALVLPELSGSNSLRMEYLVPSRGNIYDRQGRALVAQAEATSVGLLPDRIIPDQEEELLNQLFLLTGLHPDTIRAMYADFPPGKDWYLPLRAVSTDLVRQNQEALSKYDGLVLQPFRARYYFESGIAPHVVGYVSAIQEGEVEKYKRLGYQVDERVGRAGLEAWGEMYLSGKRGGVLYLVNPDGRIITKLAESSPAPAQAIYTTLDRDLQLQAQQAMVGFKGAIVVLERDTSRVLAMVSSPGFDPNLFEPTNYNRDYQIEDLFDPNTTPLLNRATQGQYPLGSIFKIITMAAAMESGLYTEDTVYNCMQTFTELPGVVLHDWTYDYGLPSSGSLTLPEGLMRSCNPYFFHIGLDLYRQGFTTAVSDMGRDFGLGNPTGIEILDEAGGQVPDPVNEIDATNLAIGQGALQVTPIQVANFTAAIGNGGVLYRPQVVERIAPPDGEPSFVFQPQERQELPISAQTLKVIQEALASVVQNPRGTAYRTFLNFSIPVAGKTGTAQDPPREPHAWFTGYTYAERPDKPDIAAVVIVENSGEGSIIAAPIFKRILEIYFLGQPRTPYWWESQIGLPTTPSPEETGTPTPSP